MNARQDLRAARQYHWDNKASDGLEKINPMLPSPYEVSSKDKPPFLQLSEVPEVILEEMQIK